MTQKPHVGATNRDRINSWTEARGIIALRERLLWRELWQVRPC